MKELNIQLVKQVGWLLSQEDATHPDFMAAVAAQVGVLGYLLNARQGGINGTYLWIEKRSEAKG